MFKCWDWEDTVYSLLIGVVILLVILGGIAALSPKNIDYYYVSTTSNSTPHAACAYAHWTWHTDEVAYCSDDVSKVLDFTTKANQSLKSK